MLEILWESTPRQSVRTSAQWYVTQDGCYYRRGNRITPIGEPNRSDVTGPDFRRSLQVGFALEKILPKGNEIKYNLRHILAVNSKSELYTLNTTNISAKISRLVRVKSISFARKSRAKPPVFFLILKEISKFFWIRVKLHNAQQETIDTKQKLEWIQRTSWQLTLKAKL